MFDNQRYITRGIDAEIPFELQFFMWDCIDRMPEPKDYFKYSSLKASAECRISFTVLNSPNTAQYF